MNKIKTLVVDDESIARRIVRDLLARDPDIEVVGEAGDGELALQQIEACRPALVFLDVHMPILSGLEALRRLKPAERPEVIFVTAYDEHAISAFDLYAVDYVVKPFTDSRFTQALERAKRRLQDDVLQSAQRTVAALLDHFDQALLRTRPPTAKDATFVLKVDGEHHFVAHHEIRWIEAQGDYIRVHTTQRKLLSRMTLVQALEQLSSEQFIRIHKSCIVNLSFVRRLWPTTAWGRPLELDDGTKLNISRSYRAAVERFL